MKIFHNCAEGRDEFKLLSVEKKITLKNCMIAPDSVFFFCIKQTDLNADVLSLFASAGWVAGARSRQLDCRLSALPLFRTVWLILSTGASPHS